MYHKTIIVSNIQNKLPLLHTFTGCDTTSWICWWEKAAIFKKQISNKHLHKIALSFWPYLLSLVHLKIICTFIVIYNCIMEKNVYIEIEDIFSVLHNFCWHKQKWSAILKSHYWCIFLLIVYWLWVVHFWPHSLPPHTNEIC